MNRYPDEKDPECEDPKEIGEVTKCPQDRVPTVLHSYWDDDYKQHFRFYGHPGENYRTVCPAVISPDPKGCGGYVLELGEEGP